MALDFRRGRVWGDLEEVVDNTPTVFQPKRVPLVVRPQGPSTSDEDRFTYRCELRYHPQITTNTTITFVDRRGATHRLFVRGIENVDMLCKEHVLLCEEVITP